MYRILHPPKNISLSVHKVHGPFKVFYDNTIYLYNIFMIEYANIVKK